MNQDYEILNLEEQEAWDLLCEDMENGLHQFDSWHEVPRKVKMEYIAKTKELK